MEIAICSWYNLFQQAGVIFMSRQIEEALLWEAAMRERMTWEQMVERYPDRWVVVANPVFDGNHPDILEGDVVDVVTDEEIGRYKADHQWQDLRYERTTESGWSGMFYADFAIRTV